MKPTRVALLSALGMLLTSVSVYSLTPPGGVQLGRSGGSNGATLETPENNPDRAPESADPSRFSDGKTLTVEGRLGHAKIARGSSGDTFVMLEVRAADGVKAKRSAPANLAIVIDRSGSMKGSRIRNAISAATTAVDRLADGDTVSVVTFDTQVQTVVSPTTLVGPSSREQIKSAIRGITLGGDTCISCGVERAMELLAQVPGKVSRMILLSDGDANHGVRDVPGFRSLAQRAQGRGVSVTTIGVDVEYNEKIMAAIAQDSNGHHYFVANDEGLARVFEQEAENLAAALASNAEAVIELGPGVELDRVYDRTFRRSGNQVIVPLGAFAGTDVKTVLLKVRVPTRGEGQAKVASVDLTYRDLVTDAEGRCGGRLGAAVVASASEASDLDPLVSGRLQRSETSAALKEANSLFEKGKLEEARRRLEAQERALKAAAETARRAAPAGRAKDVARDFESQIAAVDGASSDFGSPFATPPPQAGALATAAPAAAPPAAPQQTREGKSAVRQNQKRAVDLAF